MNNGTVGEEYCERVLFPACGMEMTRTQPKMKCVGTDKRKRPIYQIDKNDTDKAPPDYLGYKMTIGDRTIAHHVSCEVKECVGETMPYSRLSKKQREYLRTLPPQCSYVAIYWVHHNCAELFRYKVGQGSYARGTGLKTV